jgi:hypothetical protein
MSLNVCDHTGHSWLQCFNEVAEGILKINANALNELRVRSTP